MNRRTDPLFRQKQVRTKCRRWELAPAGRLGSQPSASLQRSLRRLDSSLEWYWHPHKKRWLLYRVRRHPDPASDELHLEMRLQGPRGEYRDPGPWVIDRLRQADITRSGTIDPDYARRAFLRNLDAQFEEECRRRESTNEEVHDETAVDIYHYAMKGRRHFMTERTKAMRENRKSPVDRLG